MDLPNYDYEIEKMHHPENFEPFYEEDEDDEYEGDRMPEDYEEHLTQEEIDRNND